MAIVEIKYLRDEITFGKHKGDKFKELPSVYIDWAVKQGIFVTNNPDVQDLIDECQRREKDANRRSYYRTANDWTDETDSWDNHRSEWELGIIGGSWV